MLAFKMAFKNLQGAGLRTWLNAFVLSLSFVVIIWHSGFLEGWNRQARRDMIAWQIGGGELWHQAYDPYDPLTIQDSHAPVPESLKPEIADGNLTPLLIAQASFYPEGRIQSIQLKGLDTGQTILKIPANGLEINTDEIPIMVGNRMAKSNKLQVGDYVTIRWRDAKGPFDAAEAKLVHIFTTTVPTIDNGQIWLPLDRLRSMLQMPDEATKFILKPGVKIEPPKGWIAKTHQDLLAEMDEIIRRKSIGGSILYTIMLFLAMLAIFDTQILSVFRRQKEIGTLIAMGMTRTQVIRLFTVEGAMHGVLAAVIAALYGIPLLSMQAIHGISMPEGMDDYGLAVAEKIFPYFSVGLIICTVLIVMLTTTIVSYLPTRKIAKMNPTDAIRGKLQ